jgi:transcriptional regulator with XRE-family HTH domain
MTRDKAPTVVSDVELARNIRRLREERGWSQHELARRTGLHYATVSLVEGAKRNPSTRTLGKIAAAFEIEVPDLFPKGRRRSSRKAVERPVYSFSSVIRQVAGTWRGLVEDEELEFDERIGLITAMIDLASALRQEHTRLPVRLQEEIDETRAALTEAARAGLAQSEKALEEYVREHEVEDARERIRHLTEKISA